MSKKDFAFYLVGAGMNARAPAERLPDGAYARGTNVIIQNGLLTTRPGARVVPVSGDGAEGFAAGNVQGCLFYDPQAGQGAKVLGSGSQAIMVAAGGRKYALTVTGNVANAADVTNGIPGSRDVHLVCWVQAESYAVASDGTGNAWIWDGTNPAFASAGYNTTNKEGSQIPNGGMAMAYVHSRLSIVVNSRAILTSDGLYSRDLSTAKDLLAFREQVYWATGQFFAPPTWMGEISALAILPIKDTAHGHGELMAHCAEGIFSVDLNVSPRSSWSDTPMVKVAYLGPGAAGPYAVALFDGDQLFRAADGVKTLKSARAESGQIGSPTMPASEPVFDFFSGDSPQWLRFASVEAWHALRRAFVTAYPVVSGRYRWHRGLVSLNFQPLAGQASAPAWEALWTLPPQCAGIVQQVNGRIDGAERHFCICRGTDERNRLVEFRPDLLADVLEDGTQQRIRCQVTTRRLDASHPISRKSFSGGLVAFKGIRGFVTWGVWVRGYGSPGWTFWQSGTLDFTPQVDAPLGSDPAPGEETVDLGDFPKDAGLNVSRWMQVLIRWAGHCAVECVRLSYEDNEADGSYDSTARSIVNRNSAVVDYGDFEYSEDAEPGSWLGQLSEP